MRNHGHENVIGVGLAPWGLDPRVLQYKELFIAPATMAAANTTPIEIVPSQGPNTVIEYISGFMFYQFKSSAFTGVAGGEDLTIRYTDGSGATVSTTLETTGFLDATSSQLRSFKAITTDYTPVAAAPLVLAIASGDFVTGDSPVIFKFIYRVHYTEFDAAA